MSRTLFFHHLPNVGKSILNEANLLLKQIGDIIALRMRADMLQRQYDRDFKALERIVAEEWTSEDIRVAMERHFDSLSTPVK